MVGLAAVAVGSGYVLQGDYSCSGSCRFSAAALQQVVQNFTLHLRARYTLERSQIVPDHDMHLQLWKEWEGVTSARPEQKGEVGNFFAAAMKQRQRFCSDKQPRKILGCQL